MIGSYDTLLQQKSHHAPSKQGVSLLEEAQKKFEEGHYSAARTKYTQAIEFFRLSLSAKSHCKVSREGLIEAWTKIGVLVPDYEKEHFPQVNWLSPIHEKQGLLSIKALGAFMTDTFIEGEWKKQCNGKYGGHKPEGKSWRRFYMENETILEKLGTVIDKIKWVVEYGHHHLLHFLLKNLENISEIEEDEDHPLVHIAIAKEFKDVVSILLENGTDINAVNKNGWSTMHWAAFVGNTEILSYLINQGAKVNCTDQDNVTPLHVAAERGQAEAVRLLIENNAKLNVTDKNKYMPIHLAVINGHKKVLEILLENGADFRKTDQHKRSILHWSTIVGSIEMTRLILKYAPNVQVKDDFDRTPLHWAAQYGHVDITEQLVKSKAKINVSDKFGEKPMVIAAFCGHTKVVTSLFEKEKY